MDNKKYKSRQDKRNYEENLKEEKTKTEKEMAKNREEMKKILFNDNRSNEKEKIKKPIFTNVWLSLTLVVALAFALYLTYHSLNSVNQIYEITNGILIFLTVIFFVISYNQTLKKNKTFGAVITGAFFMGFMAFNSLYLLNVIELPVQSNIPNFTGKEYTEAISWSEDNNIKYNQTFDYSDTVEKYSVISQSEKPETLTKNIKKVDFSVSNGPDYNKNVIISDMTGWNIKDVLKVIDENFLNNVKISYEENPDVDKNIVTSQSKSGNIKRNDEIEFTVSLGDKSKLKSINLKDLKNEKLLNAEVYLGQNGITYEIKYEFSNTIKKGNIISTNPKQGTKLKADDHVVITVSKGKEIKVPNLRNKTMLYITKWMIENDLQINYSDKYDNEIKSGRVIEANYKEGDIIEEGTTVDITFSKGKLKMPKLTTIDEFKSWADTNGVKYEIVEEFNNDVAQGNIIKASVNTGKAINLNETITVTVSRGQAINVPSFEGKTKNEAQNECNNLGLICSFVEETSTKKEGTIINQNISSGTEVAKGESITLTVATSKKVTTTSNKKTSSSSSNSYRPSSTNRPSNTQQNPGGSNQQSGNTDTCDRSKTITIVKQSSLNGDSAAATLKNYQNAYPGIKFTYTEKASQKGSPGMIHQDMPKSFTANYCDTYTLIIIK